MDLVISKWHASRGKRGDPQKCPTVQALKSVGFKGDIYVGASAIEVSTGTFPMPKTLRENIKAYDAGEAFKHGTYRIPGLSLPSKSKATAKK